jgi:preprotein translocase subunit SecG
LEKSETRSSRSIEPTPTHQSKAAGYANPFAKWAIILSIIFLVIGLIISIIVAVSSAALFSTVGYY